MATSDCRSRRWKQSLTPTAWVSAPQLLDQLVDLIVGKELADRRSVAGSNAIFSDAEVRNRAVRNIKYEAHVAHPVSDERVSSKGICRSASATHCQRSVFQLPYVNAEMIVPKFKGPILSSEPPDISCADMSEEQKARIYSKSNIWDPETNPVPPLQEMRGFGRFRRSVHANAAWELDKFGHDLQRLGPAALEQLGDFEIAKLQKSVMDKIRTPSRVSLTSRSDSDSSSEGKGVCRGFFPARNLHVPGKTQIGKDSAGDAMNAAARASHRGEAKAKSTRSGARLASSSEQAHAPIGLLSSVAKQAVAFQRKKKEVPLVFDPKTVADEAIDENEDEHEDSNDDFDDDFDDDCDDDFEDDDNEDKEKEEYKSHEPSLVEPPKSSKFETTDKAQVEGQRHGKRTHLLQLPLPNRMRTTRYYGNRETIAEKAYSGQRRPTKVIMPRVSSRSARLGIDQAATIANGGENEKPRTALETKIDVSHAESKLSFRNFISSAPREEDAGVVGERQVDSHCVQSSRSEGSSQASPELTLKYQAPHCRQTGYDRQPMKNADPMVGSRLEGDVGLQ